jgi:integrase
MRKHIAQEEASFEKGEGIMTIFKRGGFYWFEFIRGGERYRKPTGVKNKRDAEDIESAFRTALAKGDVGITARKKIPTFKTAMAGFLDWSRNEHKAKPGTHLRHITSSVALLRHFGADISLDKITPEEVELYKVARGNQFTTVRGKEKRKTTDKKVMPATVNRELACLRAVFNHAIKGNLPLRNPISKTAAKSLREDNEQTRVLTYDEQSRYLAVATPMLRDVATLMLETGCRPEEIYRIQPKNVHLAEGYFFNPFGKTKAAKRRIKLTATAASILVKRMALRDGEYLFPHDSDPNRPVPKVNNAHDRALRDSQVAHFRIYDLRHTWATRAAEAGIDLVTLAAMLGHSKINMVLRYAHPTQEHQTKAMDKFERFVAEQQIESAAQTQRTSEAIQ